MRRSDPRAMACLAAVVGVVVLAGCGRTAPAAPAPPPPREVEIVQIRPADLPAEFTFVGRAESSQRVEIRARVSGFLDEIRYEEGAFVDEGAELFQMDRAPFESRLRAAQAELAQHQARLESAEQLLARLEPLAADGAIAEKELDDATSRVREARAAVESAGARVYDAELNLGYTTIASPVRGLTGAAAQRQGAYISAATPPLTYVARVDPMWVEFSVTETQILRALRAETAGDIRYPERSEFEVAVQLADGSMHPETGRISFADATVSDRTGAVLVRAEVPNPTRALRPGQYVTVVLRGALRPSAVTVPQRAVRESSRGPFVWVVDSSGAAEQRPVELGQWTGRDWIITAGLREGDRVVVAGTMGLQPGAALAITRILTASDLATDADR